MAAASVAALAAAKTTTLVKTEALEVIRLVILAGKDIPEHRAPGEITVQCLEGRVAFGSGGTTRDLAAGDLLYRWKGQPLGQIYDQDGGLRPEARSIFGREVEQLYQQAIAFSQRSPRMRAGGMLEDLGRAATTVGEASDRAGNRVLGAFMILGVLLVVGLMLACAVGVISPTELGDLLRRLIGGP